MRNLQKLGRALLNPVAVLPVAALLLGLGYWIDPAGWGGESAIAAFFVKSGAAVLDNLPIIFAIGVAYGLSKDKNGAAALTGAIAFLVVTTLLSPGAVAQLRGIEVTPEMGFAKISNPFIGILSGIIASAMYNKFYQTKLPDYLAFFAGRRLVPILTSLVMMFVSLILLFVWPVFFGGLVGFGKGIASLGAFGAGIYAFFNRLLIPTGLHHALNAVFWFDVAGINDIPNFWSGTVSELPGVTTGMYQAGFFPVMMFGLPGAALAMYHTAKDNRRKVAGSLLLAGALTSFLTGVTEPLEFAFMFLAPGLYLVHALLTGLAVFLAASFKWIAGFGFSAGLVDYVLSMKIPVATNIFMLIPLGLVFGAVYYFVFRFMITKFDLKTPGREDDIDENEGEDLSGGDVDFAAMAAQILKGLGGKENIDSLDHCVTRLRVEVKDRLAVNEKEIKKTRVSGVIRPSKYGVQVIIGPQVQFVYEEVKKLVER